MDGQHDTFASWIDALLADKEIGGEEVLEVLGARGLNQIPVGILVAAMKRAAPHDQADVRRLLSHIDGAGGDVRAALRRLAGALAL
jgi:hypothetical protein